MLDNLTNRLARIVKTIRGEARLTESNVQEALREVRMALLEADVALPVVKEFIAAVKEKAMGAEVIGSLSPGQALVGVVHNELTRLMGEANAPLDFATTPPAVILMAGLQGSGKTTTTGKLAKYLREAKKKVLVVSCDVYRPAAIEQLKTVAAQVDADFFPSSVGESPADIARGAVEFAKTHYHDVLIVDTAGRLAIDEAMMKEITALHALLKPVETLFIVDAMQGQDAVNVAKAFNEALPLTGVILTKLDGDARGGAALSIKSVTGVPIKFIGTGEKTADFEPFYPERLASRILGMGDVVSLVEKAQEHIDEKEAERMAEKMRKADFNLEDFLAQMQQVKKMGSMQSLMGMMPGMSGVQIPDDAERQMKRTEAIIQSMTIQERRKPGLLNGSRRMRIAAGAGVKVLEVNQLIKQFEQMQKLMKMMKGGNQKKLMRQMEQMKGRGGMPGMPF